MQVKQAIAFAAMIFTFSAARGMEKLNDYDIEDRLGNDTAAWKEIQEALPAYPKAENLIEVQAGPSSSYRYYVDASSLSLGKDGVMRYSAVVKTTGGANNVTFEGIRCETRERKVFALGHSDGTWAQARDTSWKRIERSQPPLYLTLWRDYFCPERTTPTKPKQAIDAIKRRTPLANGPTSY